MDAFNLCIEQGGNFTDCRFPDGDFQSDWRDTGRKDSDAKGMLRLTKDIEKTLKLEGRLHPNSVVAIQRIATGVSGDETVSASALVTETGLVGTIGFGDEQVVGTALVTPTGLSATGSIGSTVIESKYAVTGFELTSGLGNENVYQDVVPSQTPNYVSVTGATTEYTNITPSQTKTWVEINKAA